MAVIQRRSTATVPVSVPVVLAVILTIFIIIVIFFLYRKRFGPFRRSPSPAINPPPDQPTSDPASWFQPRFPNLPVNPQSPRPWREAQNPPMRSELRNPPQRNYGQSVPGIANSETSVQGSATRDTTGTTQPLPGTSSTVTMFKIPTSEPVRPLPPTPSKLPPIRKATPINNNGVPYQPQRAYTSPSSTATVARTRTASNTPSPPPQQPQTAKRSPTSAGTLHNPTSHKTLRNLFSSSSTTPPPISTFNPHPNRTLRSPISDRGIHPRSQNRRDEDHPALRQPASSLSLPHIKPADNIPPILLQPLSFPLTSDTTDLSTDLANPHEQAQLGYKNANLGHQTNNDNNNQTSPPPTLSQSLKLPSSTSSRPLVNSTYANFLTTRIQNSSSPINLSPHQNSASLAALLVGSEAGTTDAGTTDAGGMTPDMNNGSNNNKKNNNNRDGRNSKSTNPAAIEAGGTTLISPTSTTSDAIRNGTGGRFHDRARGRCGGQNQNVRLRTDRIGGEVEIEERYKRLRDTGGFSAVMEDDDPVGRPWGRFDSNSNIDREVEREGERGNEAGGGGGGIGMGVGPLRVQGKNWI